MTMSLLCTGKMIHIMPIPMDNLCSRMALQGLKLKRIATVLGQAYDYTNVASLLLQV